MSATKSCPLSPNKQEAYLHTGSTCGDHVVNWPGKSHVKTLKQPPILHWYCVHIQLWQGRLVGQRDLDEDLLTSAAPVTSGQPVSGVTWCDVSSDWNLAPTYSFNGAITLRDKIVFFALLQESFLWRQNTLCLLCCSGGEACSAAPVCKYSLNIWWDHLSRLELEVFFCSEL